MLARIEDKQDHEPSNTRKLYLADRVSISRRLSSDVVIPAGLEPNYTNLEIVILRFYFSRDVASDVPERCTELLDPV